MSYSVYVPWSGDFSIDDRGYTVIADADTTYVQRLVRRLLTSPRLFDGATGTPIAAPDYLFEPEFGAGLRRMVDRTAVARDIERIVLAQVAADPETSEKTRPEVNVNIDDYGVANVGIIAVRKPNFTVIFGIKIKG